MRQATQTAQAPPLLRGEGLVYHIIRLSKGDDRALLGLWGVEAEETGHSEVSRVKGEVEWNERGAVGGGRPIHWEWFGNENSVMHIESLWPA